MEHMFWSCSEIVPLWNALNVWLKRSLKIEVNITYENMALCNYNGPHNNLVNIVILLSYHQHMTERYSGQLQVLKIFILSHDSTQSHFVYT